MSEFRLTKEESDLVVEHGSMMVWRGSPEGEADYVNPAWVEHTGTPVASLLGRGWQSLVHPEDLPACLKRIRECGSSGACFDAVLRLKRHDGAYRYVSHEGLLSEEGGEGAARVVAWMVDVDDKRRANENKTTFLSMLAHELRTPLTPVLGFLHQMEKRLAIGEPVLVETLHKLRRQAERIGQMVDHLEDAARINAGKAIGIAVEDVDLTELVRDLVDQHNRRFERRPAASRPLSAQPDGRSSSPSPPRGGPSSMPYRRVRVLLESDRSRRVVRGDPMRIRQLVLHVLANAIKFSPRGGVVTVGLDSSPFEHVVAITDSGIGIPPAELPEVSRPYFRASNASDDHFPGIGLGLTIAREIAEAHGGSLRIESVLDEGTRVTLRLPAASAPA